MRFLSFYLFVSILFNTGKIRASRLSVSGDNFIFDGKVVFQSGVNAAWYSYGYDFGNGQYASSKSTLESWLNEIAASGGNSIRKFDLFKFNFAKYFLLHKPNFLYMKVFGFT